MPLTAADHYIKGIVSTKVRVVFFLIMICYVPTCFNLLRAITPFYDWNNTYTTVWRRGINYHIPCYYMAFPPLYITATNTTMPIMTCDSVVGVGMFTVSGTGLLFFVVGLQILVFYLGEVAFQAFKKTDWYDNFEFFNIISKMFAENLVLYPWYKIRAEETKQTIQRTLKESKKMLQSSFTSSAQSTTRYAISDPLLSPWIGLPRRRGLRLQTPAPTLTSTPASTLTPNP